jgi:redox-sensitive bicupin YhaK (pirin superfamily)
MAKHKANDDRTTSLNEGRIAIRRSNDRGHADHGWLLSYHTFSFADYFDPEHVGFRALRVINEDRVKGGGGFGSHGHRDFEIISYVVSGALKHQDSMGHTAVMRAGDVQRISAGRGIEHSEYNDSAKEPVHFLQIWLSPSRNGVTPDYAEGSYANAALNALTLICSPDGANGSLRINQNAYISVGKLAVNGRIEQPLGDHRHAWIQVIEGHLDVNGTELSPGDGAAVSDHDQLTFSSKESAHFLYFDLN